MRHGYALHFIRINIEPRNQDHVFLPILDEYESVLIDPSDITGTQQIRPDHDLCRLVGSIPVTSHHLRPANTDLSNLIYSELVARVIADADLGRRNRITN